MKTYPRLTCDHQRARIAFSLFAFFLLGYTTVLFSQNYQPLSQAMSKRFVNVNNPTDDGYYFHVKDVEVQGDMMIFEQYDRRSGEYDEPDPESNCIPWGGMYELINPLWSGRKVQFTSSTNSLIFTNASNNTLQFTFNLAVGDSSLIFANDTSQWYLLYDGTTEMSFLETTDSVRTFRLRKYDLLGNEMPSPLHNFQILLSENFGLLSFIQCYQFPDVEIGLQIAGQTDPPLGYYQLTKDEVYAWQPGDTLQYHGYTPGPTSGVGTHTYRNMTITDRVESTDSVWIYWSHQDQIIQVPPNYIGSSTYISYPNPIAFRKKSPITKIPNGATYNNELITFDEPEYCGLRKRLQSTGNWIEYCDSCDCYIPVDGFGTYIHSSTTMSGLGITNTSSTPYGFELPMGSIVSLIYSHIGDEICGEYFPLLVSEDFTLGAISLYPNPTQDKITVEISNARIQSIQELTFEITDTQGRLLETLTFQHVRSNLELDMQQLTEGIYVVKMLMDDQLVHCEKVVKE
jgi:hypothetical protein